jgi:hypothetical protein
MYTPLDEHAATPAEKVTLTMPALVSSSTAVFIDGVMNLKRQ